MALVLPDPNETVDVRKLFIEASTRAVLYEDERFSILASEVAEDDKSHIVYPGCSFSDKSRSAYIYRRTCDSIKDDQLHEVKLSEVAFLSNGSSDQMVAISGTRVLPLGLHLTNLSDIANEQKAGSLSEETHRIKVAYWTSGKGQKCIATAFAFLAKPKSKEFPSLLFEVKERSLVHNKEGQSLPPVSEIGKMHTL
jgi:hypothetical protein